MNRQSTKKALLIPFILMVLTSIALVVVWFIFKPLVATIAAAILVVMIIISIVLVRQALLKMDNYVDNLSGHISAGSNRAIKRLPIGMVVLDADDHIEWINQYMSEHLETNVISEPVNEVFPNILKQLEKVQEVEIEHGQYHYHVRHSEEESCLYFFDITDEVQTNELYEESKPIIATLFLDNYDEITQNMNDTQRSEINSMVTRVISRWASEYNIYFKRYNSDQFVAYLNQKILAEIEESNFEILSQLREKSVGYRAQLTLSIGVGEGTENLIDLGELSQSGLDLALGRGGDQVAIKNMNGNVRFYGGKTDPMEKRTRVRARVISHALKDILTEGDKVIIMGHKRPDLDAIGAAIGVSRFALMNNLEAYVVLNEEDIDPTLRRVMDEIDKKPELKERFVTSDEAWDMMTSKSTIVVVDTHKPEMVLDENILNKANRKVVIDHHRRGESFISNPLLVYMEPYASSTAELVTELLEYQPTEQRLTRLESTVMYAGIIVDTRNFTLRTGSRTFDAASYLRAHGADTILTQHFLKDDVDTYINRSELIRTVEVQDNGIAIAHGSNEKIYHPVTVAQAADELLSLEGIEASYVVAKREDNLIGISARSLGSINVQLTMEALGGGGHLTNAATQLKGLSIEEAIEQLQQAITEQMSRSEDA
ncbi:MULTISPECIES: DHH family phosphoesterase [Staphylococcus]|jgi:c-di-AMP phosphodiesterase-like protein|uniref:Cyclic-di-AMP phosphodiesterase n=3 Tax=Staphylococcus haemolyticus TaxID=1283 RepID=A0A2T4SSM6_STAHA|nr:MULTISPECIES: DHH family phosphoesterase [Staphylococcus]SIJ10078.1 Bifunctional oligoribonuclease and PAP phosphatase nrnA [Mycobacteroides abscessus subsp. abscessus]AKC74903.1 bifunctional signaling protein/50S ribosomal protein L9 [Staphylococcus haemolyticus]AUV66192.1 DHH family phosphoesterase [Staphylococcus haemolyticus]AUV68577.1 DHH family phosphoesterase [Staphylococcus haemolyticus]AVH46494.1 DHH family phosphoesterase [Staphylococcus haemolyticus]